MTQSNRPADGALTSWKEIANYFNREVRTVQLWEKEEGLPVHRHLHRRQSSVYAYREELEKWWKERGSAAEGVPAEVEPASQAAGEPIEVVSAWSAPTSVPQTSTSTWRKWALATAAIAIVAAISWMGWRPTQSSTTETATRAEAVAFRSNMAGMEPNAFRMADFDGDGRDDLIFAAGPHNFQLHVRFLKQEPAQAADLADSTNLVIHGPGNGALEHSAADLNGDGIRDLIITELLNEPQQFTRTGETFVLWGRKRWPASVRLPADADVTLHLDYNNDARVSPCASFDHHTDLDGDGVDDLLLSAFEFTEDGRRSAGAIFVVHGRRNWPRKIELVAGADVRIVGARTGEGLSGSCNIGDFNGDGRADLAMHASEATLWHMRGRRGRTYVFYGRANWPRRLDAATEFDFRVDGEHAVPAGTSLSLADVSGDGLADLVIVHSTSDEGTKAGEVAIWFGGGQRRGVAMESGADVRIAGAWPSSEWGTPLAAYDVDADGMADLIIGAPVAGKVTLVYGRRKWKPSGSLAEFGAVTLFSGATGTAYGHMTVGDANADLLPDLLIGTRPGLPAAREGSAWLVKMHQRLALDVRPTMEPNILYLPEGVLVARITGVSRPVADLLDLRSLRLAGALPTEQVQSDYDGDGIADLQLYFETATLRVTPETKRVVLTARTREGLPAGATNSVQVVMKSAAHRNAPATTPD